MTELIVLDIETTGLDLKKDSIIEIAAVLLNDGKVVDKFQTLIKPSRIKQLSSTISVLTGINDADLVNAPGLNDVRDKLLTFVGDRPVVGHNISFDLDFLKANDVSFPGADLDTLELAHTILPKLRFYSLEYLAYYYQFSHQPSHRAMSDVLATVDLLDLLVDQVCKTEPPMKKKINLLIDKSDWEWAFIFKDNIASTRLYQPISNDSGNTIKDLDISKLVDLDNLKPGFNLFELSPQIELMPANIALAQETESAMLVVSNDVFYKFDWTSLGFNVYHSSYLMLDKNRFSFLISKSELNITELKLAIKVLLHGHKNNIFDPSRLYLTKDEFYLFEQKLSLSDSPSITSKNRLVTNFSGFWELLENNNIPTDYTIFIPQWISFDDFSLQKQTKVITSAYLNAVVSSRRDFVHDFVEDNKLKDELFKSLNQLGTHLVMMIALLGLVGQEQQKIGSIIEFDESFFSTKNGTRLKNTLQGVIQVLADYKNSIENLKIKSAEILARQLTHTQDLIDYLKLLLDTNKAYKIYLEIYDQNVLLRIIKDKPINVWQFKLKNYKIVIASNGISVDGKNGFISDILADSAEIKNVQPKETTVKDMIWVRDLPDSKSANYQKQIRAYLKQWLDKEPGKSIIVMPNARMATEFFDEYQSKIDSVVLLNRDIAGNIEILKSKLNSIGNFSLVVSSYNLNRLLPAISSLDRIVFIKLPFEPPNKISQLLYSDQFDNNFISYALPKAIVNFKQTLADIFCKSKEIWMLDSKLLIQDYGRVVRRSLKGFREIEEKD